MKKCNSLFERVRTLRHCRLSDFSFLSLDIGIINELVGEKSSKIIKLSALSGALTLKGEPAEAEGSDEETISLVSIKHKPFSSYNNKSMNDILFLVTKIKSSLV